MDKLLCKLSREKIVCLISIKAVKTTRMLDKKKQLIVNKFIFPPLFDVNKCDKKKGNKSKWMAIK